MQVFGFRWRIFTFFGNPWTMVTNNLILPGTRIIHT